MKNKFALLVFMFFVELVNTRELDTGNIEYTLRLSIYQPMMHRGYITYDKNFFEKGAKGTFRMHGAWSDVRVIE
ncbi:MAG: hypothetical protein FWB86_06170 [Treponema sp.]|nr:hypothetical protein [Treponema sp.]MCL2250765.1 hypothetical protein [Treponema sp.]